MFGKMQLLKIKDKKIFAKYLAAKRHDLAVYNFANIYIWSSLYDINWQIIDKNLCVFFKDRFGCFMNFPPLGKKISQTAIRKSIALMDSHNSNKDISRIENIEEADLAEFKKSGLKIAFKSNDYICRRTDLAGLKGNKFKHKRAAYNYFIKHYDFEFLDFSSVSREACLDLFKLWQEQRGLKSTDKVYLGMMEDSLKCLEVLLKDFAKLGLTGCIVKVDNQVKGFSLGFALNKQTFCILYEITDLTVKGLAQFIFRAFCSKLKKFNYINIMDDSGLENLKKVKLSYNPVKLAPAYIASR